jgi:hypothetical protein
MDQRLFRIHGTRPQRLTKQDLPQLAKAMVAYMRKEASVERAFAQNIAYVRFSGVGINVLVRSEDWVKVVPYLRDGTFNAIITPVGKDSDMYYRILRTLDPLFPADFP